MTHGARGGESAQCSVLSAQFGEGNKGSGLGPRVRKDDIF
jgi:hypothetical protein